MPPDFESIYNGKARGGKITITSPRVAENWRGENNLMLLSPQPLFARNASAKTSQATNKDSWMTKKAFAWLVITLLALVVAGYASTMLFAPEFRPPLVRSLFSARPIAAFGHFLGGAIALVAGAFQINSRIRTRFIAAHRWLGRLYVLAVAIGGVAAFVLALHSSGGLTARAGFGLLAVCWMGSTYIAYRQIRRGNLSTHRSWMLRSYGLTLAAVTLRLYLPLSQLAGLPIAVAYPAISWLCWVPNLLIVEWLVRSRHPLAITAEVVRQS